MDFEWSEQHQEWRREVRAFLDEHMGEALWEEQLETGDEEFGPLAEEFLDAVQDRGWFGLTWSEEYGGLDKSPLELFILIQEFQYAGAPRLPLATTMLGPTIVEHGTEANKDHWLPRIIRGEVEMALGYSEPDAGTDLANLSTRAERDGDEWVINGQKIWNSGAHHATHEWLAVRTDPGAPKHEGISVIVVPIDAEGVKVQPLWPWGDTRTNQVYFDDVRVPAEYLIGEENRGWQYIVDALDFERIYIGSAAALRRLFDDLLGVLRETVVDGQTLASRPHVRRKMAELDMDLEVAYLFGLRAAWMLEQGRIPNQEASMSKIFTTELRTKLSDWGMRMLDRFGALRGGDETAPLRGRLEAMYRRAPYLRFGGGANEIQRNIIAQRGLGLPRG